VYTDSITASRAGAHPRRPRTRGGIHVQDATLVGLAMLKVNFDQEGGDYLDNFVPFIAESLRETKPDVVAPTDLQRDLLERFGLDIPLAAIDLLLRRTRGRGYVRLQHGAYRPVTAKLDQVTFGKAHALASQRVRMVVSRLRQFSTEKHKVEWNDEETHGALAAYLAQYGTVVLSARLRGTTIPVGAHLPKGGHFIVASFITEAYERDPPLFDALDTLDRGNMLANVLFHPDASAIGKRFRNTQIFIDAPALLESLMTSGAEARTPCHELIALLEDARAQVRCFVHTTQEIVAVLLALERSLLRGTVADNSGWRFRVSFGRLRRAGRPPSDLSLLAANLEANLSRLGVTVVPAPDYSDQTFVIDEAALDQRLKEAFPWTSDDARIRDIRSIAAIVRIRGGRQPMSLEDAGGLFVTMNERLVAVSEMFLSKQLPSQPIPYTMDCQTLTNLLWLKRPHRCPDLPRLTLIANAYAALEPGDALWWSYLKEIERQRGTSGLSEEQYFEMRASLEAHRDLARLTLGDATAFTAGTAEEIRELVHERIRSGVVQELQGERQRHEQTRGELTESRAEVAAIDLRIRALARKVGVVGGWITTGGCTLAVAAIVWVAASTLSGQLAGFLAAGVLGVLTIVDLVWGVRLASGSRRVGKVLSRFVESLLSRVAQPPRGGAAGGP